MTEHESNTEPTIGEALTESLTKQLAEANASIERIEKNRDYYHSKYTAYENSINRAKDALFEAVKDGDIEADDTLVETLADIFGWSLTTEVEVTLTATFTGTLTMPLGKTLDDIDSDDFNAEITLGWEKNREDWEFELGDTELELEEN
jgi:hypothetical protein